MLNYATEHIPHVVVGIPFAAFCKIIVLVDLSCVCFFFLSLVMVVIMSKEIYKANAYQYNVYKRRLMGL